MSRVTTDRKIDLASLPFAARMTGQGGQWVIEAGEDEATLQAAVDAASTDDREARWEQLRSQAEAALSANDHDLAEDEAIITQATAIAQSTGTPTTAQLVTAVRQLAQGVAILADNDRHAKQQLNVLIQLVVGALKP